MKEQKVIEKLEQILSPDLEEICKNLIVKNEFGYWVFGVYFLTKEQHGILVTKNQIQKGVFSGMRSALSWCIADKYNQFVLSQEIIKLDQQKWTLKTDIDARLKVSRNMHELDRREAIETKLSTKQINLRGVTERLDKCVNLAKYWQIRGFNNEIARTRQPTPNRTNRSSNRKSLRQPH